MNPEGYKAAKYLQGVFNGYFKQYENQTAERG